MVTKNSSTLTCLYSFLVKSYVVEFKGFTPPLLMHTQIQLFIQWHLLEKVIVFLRKGQKTYNVFCL